VLSENNQTVFSVISGDIGGCQAVAAVEPSAGKKGFTQSHLIGPAKNTGVRAAVRKIEGLEDIHACSPCFAAPQFGHRTGRSQRIEQRGLQGEIILDSDDGLFLHPPGRPEILFRQRLHGGRAGTAVLHGPDPEKAFEKTLFIIFEPLNKRG